MLLLLGGFVARLEVPMEGHILDSFSCFCCSFSLIFVGYSLWPSPYRPEKVVKYKLPM